MRLRIGTKLGAGFIAVLALMALIAAVGAFSVLSVRNSANRATDVGGRMNAIALEIEVHNLEARRREKDFLLGVPVIGVEQSKDRYVGIVSEEVDKIEALAIEGASIAPAAADRQRFQDIARLSRQFEEGFLSTVALYEQRGGTTSGAIGDLTVAAAQIDASVPAGGAAAAAFTDAQLAERQYMLAKQDKDAEATLKAMATFAASSGGALAAQGDAYVAAFTRVVDLDHQIRTAEVAYKDSGLIVQTGAEQIADSGVAASASAGRDIDSTSTTSIALVLGISIFALVVGTALTVGLTRSIVAPVRELTAVAERVSMGEADLVVERRSSDEIGDLAESFARVVTAVRFYQSELEQGESEAAA